MHHRLEEFEAFFSRPPTGYNISAVQRLRPFIQEYPDEELAPSLRRLEAEYRYYRAIHGDGNCFYRAIMFLYLREAELGNYERLFPHTDLLACRSLPFKNHQGLTSDALLEYAWQRYLLPLADLRPLEREKQLERLINSSVNFDAILVAYFRALNYDYILRHRGDFQTFSYGGFQEDLERIITFGKESEGLQLFTLAVILQAQITVLMVHKDIYQKIQYNQSQRTSRNYIVSYRPGHYDIPSNDQQYIESKISNTSPLYDHYSQTTNTNQYYGSYTPGSSEHNLMSESPFSKKKSNSYQPEVIIIKKPSELMRVSGPSRMQVEKKKPTTLNEFKRKVDEKTPSKITSRPAPSSNLSESSKGQAKNVTKIRSSFSQNQSKQKRQRIVFESSICLGVIALIILGLIFI